MYDITQLTPALASPKKSRTSCSFAGSRERMKIVQGFLGGLLLVGVRAPALLSATGDITPSSVARRSGVALPDFNCCCGVGLLGPSVNVGVAGLLPPSLSLTVPASRSTRSCCLRSFLRSRLARSLSALSAAPALFGVAPFGLSLGVSRPESVDPGGGVVGFDFDVVRYGGPDLSASKGVPGPLVESVGVADAPEPAFAVGEVVLAEFGSAVVGVAVRRYA